MNAADLLEQAAGMLRLEEVMYSLGLDHDHERTVDHVEATLPDGSKVVVEVQVSDEEAAQRMADAITAHEQFVAAMEAAAAELRGSC